MEPISISAGYVFIKDKPVEAFANVNESGATIYIINDDDKPMIVGNISTNDIRALFAVANLMESMNKSNYDALENPN